MTESSASTGPPVPVRLLMGLHVCVGMLLLIALRQIVQALSHQRIDCPVRLFARSLGARHLTAAVDLPSHTR